MENPSTFDMDLEGWELLSKDDPSKSFISKGVDCFGQAEDMGKAIDQEERIIREIKSDPPPPSDDDDTMNSPLDVSRMKDDGVFGDAKIGLRWGEEEKEKAVVEEEEETAKDAREEGGEFVCSGLKRRRAVEGFGFSVWGWRISGIGALCTIGVAAATICVFVLGGRNRQKEQHQSIQLQIYTDDKNLKQMVHQATMVNQAISAARGVTLSRANISFGGHYADI